MAAETNMMFPVGTIAPALGTFSASGNSGSYDDSIVVTNMPPWMQECVGTQITNVKSTSTGRYVPDLSDERFLQGSSSGGIKGGNPSHEVDFQHNHDLYLEYLDTEVTQAQYTPVDHNHRTAVSFTSGQVTQPSYTLGSHSHTMGGHTHSTSDHTHVLPSHFHFDNHFHVWGKLITGAGTNTFIHGTNPVDGNILDVTKVWPTGGGSRGTRVLGEFLGSAADPAGDLGFVLGFDRFNMASETDATKDWNITTGAKTTTGNDIYNTVDSTSSFGFLGGAGITTGPSTNTTGGPNNTTLSNGTSFSIPSKNFGYYAQGGGDLVVLDSGASVSSTLFTVSNELTTPIDIRPQYMQVRFYKRIY